MNGKNGFTRPISDESARAFLAWHEEYVMNTKNSNKQHSPYSGQDEESVVFEWNREKTN
jgi:hypothetical protein